MNYEQTIRYLYSQLPVYQRQGASAYKSNLDNTIALMQILQNPYNSFKSIHVAGTNGKGSVSHLLASVLQEAGYKTGLYTSPHLKDFRERIRINGEMISKEKVIEFVRLYKEPLRKIKPSFFEMTVGMAFRHFASEKVDIAVVEVGLGGSLDSTNVITPEVSVITNIGMDHMQFLGNSLQEIAKEKAGIIKEGIPVVIGETQGETKSIFLEHKERKKTSLSFADQEIQKLGFPTRTGWKPVTDYQQRNLKTVLATVKVLRSKGYKISEVNIGDGVHKVTENTGLMGRWQRLSEKPLSICDVGHNEDGLREVVREIKNLNFDKLHFVFGSVNDKAPDKILALLPKEARYYFCKADIPRGMPVQDLMRSAGRFGLIAEAYPSVKDAFDAAINNSSENDLVFIGGSTFIVAEHLLNSIYPPEII